MAVAVLHRAEPWDERARAGLRRRGNHRCGCSSLPGSSGATDQGIARRSVVGDPLQRGGRRDGSGRSRRPTWRRRQRRQRLQIRRQPRRRLRHGQHGRRQNYLPFLLKRCRLHWRGIGRHRARVLEETRTQSLGATAPDQWIAVPRLPHQRNAMHTQLEFAARRQIEDRARVLGDRRAVINAHLAFGIQLGAQLAGQLVATDIDPGDALLETRLHDALLREHQTAKEKHAILGRTEFFRPRRRFIGIDEERLGFTPLIELEAVGFLAGRGGGRRGRNGDRLYAVLRRGSWRRERPTSSAPAPPRRSDPERAARTRRPCRETSSARAGLPASGTRDTSPRRLQAKAECGMQNAE